MKKIIIALSMLLSIFCISSIAFADSTPTNHQSEEVTKLRDQLQQLQGQVKDHKTLADVADKALYSLSGSLSSIEGLISKSAPYVWKIMIRQQYTKAISNLILPFVFLFICVLWKVIISLYWKKYTPEQIKEMSRHSYSDDNYALQIVFRTVVPLVFIAISSLVFFGYAESSVRLIANPEYYAIHDTVNLVLHPDKTDE